MSPQIMERYQLWMTLPCEFYLTSLLCQKQNEEYPLPSPPPCRSWHIDNETNEGTYFVTGTNLTDYHSQLFSYSYQACPRTGCPPPGYEGPLEDE